MFRLFLSVAFSRSEQCSHAFLDSHYIATHLYHTSPGYKAANIPLARRNAREAVDVSSPSSSGPNSSVYGYVLPVLLVTMAVLALMISAAVCVKGEHNDERWVLYFPFLTLAPFLSPHFSLTLRPFVFSFGHSLSLLLFHSLSLLS